MRLKKIIDDNLMRFHMRGFHSLSRIYVYITITMH